MGSVKAILRNNMTVNGRFLLSLINFQVEDVWTQLCNAAVEQVKYNIYRCRAAAIKYFYFEN